MSNIHAPKDSGYILKDDPATPKTSATVPFRELVPPADHPKIAGISKHDARSWCQSRREIPAPAWLINRLEARNLEQPYRGFTSDGHVKEGLYRYGDDEGAPVEDMAEAADALLRILTAEQQEAVLRGSVDEDEFRLWSNPELYMNPGKRVKFHFSFMIIHRMLSRWPSHGRVLFRGSTGRAFSYKSIHIARWIQ